MRKTTTVVIDAPGRDAGKQFFITEMSAIQAERWGTRALLALAKSRVEVPEDIAKAGLAGIASFGLHALGGMAFEDADPLLAEMMGCVQIIPNPAVPQVRRALIEDDIEEIATILRLRSEVFELHTGFSIAASLSTFRAALAAQSADPGLPTIPTSPAPSEPSSQAA